MKHSNAKMIALALVGILLLLSVPAGAYFQDHILAATAKVQYRISLRSEIILYIIFAPSSMKTMLGITKKA